MKLLKRYKDTHQTFYEPASCEKYIKLGSNPSPEQIMQPLSLSVSIPKMQCLGIPDEAQQRA